MDGKIDSQNRNIVFAVDWKCACYVKNATNGMDVQVMGNYIFIIDFIPRMSHLL